MTCKDVIEFLMAYLDGALESPVRGEFERHLSRCSACVAYLDTYKKSVQLAREACAGGSGRSLTNWRLRSPRRQEERR